MSTLKKPHTEFVADWALRTTLDVLTGFGAAFHAAPVPGTSGNHYSITYEETLHEQVYREVRARLRELGK